MATSLRRNDAEPLRNIRDGERVASVAIGMVFVVAGLRRRSVVGGAAAAAGSALVLRGVTGRSPVYERMGRPPMSYRRPVRVVETMQVGVPPAEAYRAWRDLERLPRFMRHVRSVVTTDGTSHWKAEFSGLPPIEWDAQIIQDVPGEVLSWRSSDDRAPIENAGSVTFFDLGSRGTGLRVEIGYYPPAGALGKTIARLFSPVTERQVREDVRRFKSLLEAGEIPTTEGQPTGAGRARGAGR
jgi:uncharacterized membrane protein